MLTAADVESVLARLPQLTLGVVGDLFLDRYLDLDASLTEPSLETGLDAYQVVRVRSDPGAAGTVVNNLVALGVGCVLPVAVIGEDGEGFELRQALAAMPAVDPRWLLGTRDRRTPTYTKPMLCRPGEPPRELNRLDVKNRSPLPTLLEEQLLRHLANVWEQADALIVLDQVSEADCGVVTGRVREWLADRGQRHPEKFVLADSRERIGLFRLVCLKPNERECRRALETPDDQSADVEALASRAGRPVFCTRGERGIRVVDPRARPPRVEDVPAYPVQGLIDVVGAGDSTSAGIACAVASGLDLAKAAAFGNLIASITIQQIGTTGTATPDQVRARFASLSL